MDWLCEKDEAERAAGIDLAKRQMDQTMEVAAAATDLARSTPGLSFLTALAIAGDRASAERAKAWVVEGCPAEEAQIVVGSYARLDFVVWALERGRLSEEWVLRNLPDIWRGSDPDDTDVRFLALWHKAFAANGGRTVRDGPHLPKGRVLRAYRGQSEGDPLGIAWSLDRQIARRFAEGVGLRQQGMGGIPNPVIYETLVPRGQILGYLTGRGESEVIIPTIGLDFTSA